MDTPHWTALEPLDVPLDDDGLECLLVNTGAHHCEEQIRAYAEGAAVFQSDVATGWMTLPVMLLVAIRRAVREIKRQRVRITLLETALADVIALERTTVHAPRMDGKSRTYAYMQNGPSLARTLDHARDLLSK